MSIYGNGVAIGLNAPQHKFKVGDWVIGAVNNAAIGACKVIMINSDGTYDLKTSDGKNTYNFIPGIRLVAHAASSQHNFKIGDYVTSSADHYAEVYKVMRIDANGSCDLSTFDASFYPNVSMSILKAYKLMNTPTSVGLPNPKYEVGDKFYVNMGNVQGIILDIVDVKPNLIGGWYYKFINIHCGNILYEIDTSLYARIANGNMVYMKPAEQKASPISASNKCIVTKDTCECDMNTLMRTGCRCGYIKPYKPTFKY